MLLSAFLYTAFVAALAIALLLLAHVTALAIIAVGVGLLRRTSIMT
jgi:hypothetical protein